MRYNDISDLAKGLDPEPDGEREGCCFLDSLGRCHYEPVVLGYGSPCADCPDDEAGPGGRSGTG